MNLTVQPRTGLSRFFNDWLRPNSIFDKDFFDPDFNTMPMYLGVNVPSVNIKDTQQEYALEFAAPGLKRSDFKIELDNHTLTISAEKEEKKEDGKKSEAYCRKEYSYQSFSRSFLLPENISEDEIEAKYADGILTVHVPKKKETPVKSAQKIAVS